MDIFFGSFFICYVQIYFGNYNEEINKKKKNLKITFLITKKLKSLKKKRSKII